MSKQTITIEVNPEFFENMKKQKRAILVLQGSKLIPESVKLELDGTLSFFDHIQDTAIDELGYDKNQVLDLSPDEDENPEGYKAHTAAYETEVKNLDSQIVETYKQKYY